MLVGCFYFYQIAVITNLIELVVYVETPDYVTHLTLQLLRLIFNTVTQFVVVYIFKQIYSMMIQIQQEYTVKKMH